MAQANVVFIHPVDNYLGKSLGGEFLVGMQHSHSLTHVF